MDKRQSALEGLVVKALPKAFTGRRVLVTGHTGFKGAWMSIWLAELGAQVHGYALSPATRPSLYDEAKISGLLASEALQDIRDAGRLRDFVAAAKPEIVFHMAAQPLVRRSYREPRETWETNVLGTINLLEAVRATPGVRVCVVITSDKCYENPEQVCSFRESDPMGGHDPYSSSKGAAEIAVSAWRRSYFHPAKLAEHGVSLSSARAGNVIGGGDWAEDRLIPDCVRALQDERAIAVRNPAAIRPWQHVLEPLSGYLQLAARQLNEPAEFADAYNFGPLPIGHLTVAQVSELVVKNWGSGRWEHVQDASVKAADHFHEAAFLKLDITKATSLLHWRPILSAAEAIQQTVEWYRTRHREQIRFDARSACLRQIAAYQSRIDQ
jgi:CDP-glucose 4,6-dehydratase